MGCTMAAVESKTKAGKSLLLHAVVVLLLSEGAIATTAVLVLTRRAIVIGIDSQLTPVSLGMPLPNTPRIKKMGVVQNRMVVAVVGADLVKIWGKKEGRFVFTYDFTTWIANVKKKCPKDATVSVLTHLVEVESGAAFKDFSQFINAYWTGHKEETTNFIDYLVVGYQGGVPTVNRVYFKVDWN